MQDYSRLFWEDSIRGVYPIELSEDVAFKLGRAIALHFPGEAIVVGRDCRIGSDKLAAELIRGLTMQGSSVLDLGVCSTPMLYFAAQEHPGVMVTASHYPREFCGFKICQKGANAMGGNGLQVIRELVEKNAFPKAKKKGRVQKKDIRKRYLTHLKQFSKGIRKSLKVVVDAGNGVGGILSAKAFPCKVIPLFCSPDGNFPHHAPNPRDAETLHALGTAVRQEKADLGIAYDGDGDEVVFVDEKGSPVPAGLALVVLARHVLKRQPHAKMLYEAGSQRIVKDTITRLGGIAVMTRAGHAYVNAVMREENAALGGELSGHFYFRENFFTDSGEIAALVMLQALSAEKKKLSALVAPLQKAFRAEERVAVEDPLGVLDRVEAAYRSSGAKLFHVEGLSVEFPDWCFTLKPSHTEPFVLVRIEAKTKALLERRKKELQHIIKK